LIKTKRKIIIFTIIVLLVLSNILSLSYFIYRDYQDKNSKSKEDNSENKILDNRISPLENQGLILEINRIRNRDFLNIIMKPGLSWKNKPSFTVEIVIDNLKYSKYSEISYNFNTWDTIGKNFRVIRDAEEEQEKSEIQISISQKEKRYIFLSQKKLKEKINIIYDYRTGQWDGDDYFLDNDGYGHFVGNFYEIWFNIYQTDFDYDSIPYWTEVNILHTDPMRDDSDKDPDGDGIPTTWEWKWGYDPFIWDDHEMLDPDIDGLTNDEEYQMEKWFADPFSQDIYIEVDGMQKKGLFDRKHILYDESQQIIIERFTRHGINLYIDNGWSSGLNNGGGELLPYINKITWDSGIILQFYKNNFPEERRGIFRYLIICNSGGLMEAWSGNTEFNRYDTMLCSNGLKTTLIYQRALTQRTQRLLMASTVLHEIGHTLGIAPYTIEGNDNLSFLYNARSIRDLILKFREYKDKWGNYKSVMNYLYVFDKKLVDYSDGSHGNNDQNDWEKFYLPFFQIENNIIIEPGITPPATDKVVNENISIELDGWEYSKDLSEEYFNKISSNSKVDPNKCEVAVFIKTNDTNYPSNRDIRIYVQPSIPITGWSLIREDYLMTIKN